MYTFHQSMRMILDDQEPTCISGFLDRSKSSTELNRFHILASYCREISKGKDVSEVRHKLSVRE